VSDPAAEFQEDDFDPTADEELAESEYEISLEEIVHSLARLLPDDQELQWFDADRLASDALIKLQRAGYSQAPVRQGTRYVGVFSYRSFARAVTMVGSAGPLAGLTVSDCLEELPFATVHDKIEDVFEDLDRFDAVLVGSREDVRGIVTVMDTLRYLFELANPYVLMQQIELGLRHSIRRCVDDRGLAESVELVVAQRYRRRGNEPPQRLPDMYLTDLLALITADLSQERFVPVFGANTALVKSLLDPLPRIRNDLFHFKGSLPLDDYERLATTRDWLLRKLANAEVPPALGAA
jgi:hypothetical protein